MKEIRVIKDFYLWKDSGKIDVKRTVYCIKPDGQPTFKETFIHVEDGAKKLFEALKKHYPDAKVRYADKTTDPKNIHKYKVMSEDIVNSLNN
ncbi:MAG: hypothetical protein WDZ41_01965 [Candidatus Babeliales bacterium]